MICEYTPLHGVPHTANPPALVVCKECGKIWCCMECCCEGNGLDHKHFDMISDFQRNLRPKDRVYPDQFDIVCCYCSGAKRSWEDREYEELESPENLS